MFYILFVLSFPGTRLSVLSGNWVYYYIVFKALFFFFFSQTFPPDGICQQIVPPVINSFSDQDSRVRYYACEALYNIAKVRMNGGFYYMAFFPKCIFVSSLTSVQVVRGDFIVFFNQIFDALCKLSADSDANVQSAAHLLDRLVKVNNYLYQLYVYIHSTHTLHIGRP